MSAPSYKLRPYQTECLLLARQHLEQFDSALIVMATGLGKTVLFSHLAGEWPTGRVLVIAHREELIRQAVDKLQAITPHSIGVEMAEERAQGQRIVVSSIQTLSRENRLSRFNPADFGLIIIDEAHHVVANTYRRVIDYFRQNASCKVLGVTATPKRADELALGQVFASVAYEYGIEPASEDGWLDPVVQRVVRVEGMDFSECRTLAGDFNESDLEAVICREEMIHKVAAPTVELTGDLPTLVFCVTVKHAEKMSEVIGRYKKQSSAWLCGETPREQRREVIDRFRAGKVQYLCNVALFLEGFDAPNCACVAMARPTKSLALYTQVIGRATRTLPGVIEGLEQASAAERKAAIAASAKPHMMVLDYAGNAGRHKIITAADVLGGKYAPPVREYALKTAEEEKRPALVGEALERAEAELALIHEEEERLARKAREAAALEFIKAQAAFRTQEVSPFGGVGSTAPQAKKGRAPWEMPTDGQIRFLLYLGIGRAAAESYTKKQASAVIDKLKKQKGLS